MKGGTCSTLLDLGGLLADLKDALASNADLVEARCLHPYIRDRVRAEALPLLSTFAVGIDHDSCLVDIRLRGALDGNRKTRLVAACP